MGKTFAIIGGVIAVGLIVVASLLLMDALDLQKKFRTEDKKFLLDIDHRIEAGLIVGNVQGFEKQETFTFLEDIYQLNDYYIDEKYDELLGDSYKLFIFKRAAFSDIDEIRFGAVDLKTADAFKIIESFDEREEFSRITGVNMAFIEELYTDDNQFETFLFARLVFSSLEQKGPIWMVKEIKKGNIVIYPKTITFVLAKVIPDSTFEEMLSEEQVEKIKKEG